ncbi:MAG TPA: hypothetical protein VFV38_29680 [Ktedonobacteraceae bacterium]|nr:hypothetical protein [Ktedonobacteraceae bacterium]
MNQFPSIRKIDQAILYCLELASSVSVLLLAFGLIASMANVLTKGSILSDNSTMQHIWVWTQTTAIDTSVAGTIIRTYHSLSEKAWAKFTLYALLSCLLLFTAAIVSNIESVQQTLHITLDSAYTHVFIPVEALIWVRSFVIVLLIVAHALRHVQTREEQEKHTEQPLQAVTPQLLNELKALLSSTSISEEQQEQPNLLPETLTATEEQEAQAVTLYLLLLRRRGTKSFRLSVMVSRGGKSARTSIGAVPNTRPL